MGLGWNCLTAILLCWLVENTKDSSEGIGRHLPSRSREFETWYDLLRPCAGNTDRVRYAFIVTLHREGTQNKGEATLDSTCYTVVPALSTISQGGVEAIALRSRGPPRCRARGTDGCHIMVPAALLSNNGPQCKAALLKEFCVSMGINKVYSTP